MKLTEMIEKIINSFLVTLITFVMLPVFIVMGMEAGNLIIQNVPLMGFLFFIIFVFYLIYFCCESD